MIISTIILGTKKIKIYSFLFLIFIFSSCANIVAPSGGPQDKTPPKLIKSQPERNQSNFSGKEIILNFDEYIVLKDIANQLFISPPFENKPEVKVKGKALHIELKEDLIPNTTYIFNFGDAIADLHEGNPLTNFELVFSTGNSLDSMSYYGRVIDAFTSEPEKDALVMLYKKNYDSVPFLEKPLYISKTDSKGYFAFSNIENVPYKIVAINDINKNLKYNQYVEKIAFESDLIQPVYVPRKINDSTSSDTSNVIKRIVDNGNSMILRTFMESSAKQKIIKSSFITNNQIVLALQKPDKNIAIKGIDLSEKLFIPEWNEIHDTLVLWLLKDNIDSIKIILSDNLNFTDSVTIKKTAFTKKAPVANIRPSSNITPVFDYFNNIKLTFPYPLLNTDSLSLILIEDSVAIPIKAYSINKSKRIYQSERKLKQKTDYQLIYGNRNIYDLNNNIPDSLRISFKTNGSEDFGNVLIDFIAKDSTCQYIIQLIDEKNKVVEEKIIKGSYKIRFVNIRPGNYTLKAIADRNKNNIWDTGNYLLKIQPENTFLFPSKINVKANWDIEEKWIE